MVLVLVVGKLCVCQVLPIPCSLGLSPYPALSWHRLQHHEPYNALLQVDDFVLDLGTTDVGPKLLKLDIGFASKSSTAGSLGGLLGQSWGLGSVEVMHMATGARQLFVHNGWVDRSQRCSWCCGS
jgi:hypothetical protein